jgi:hypothetical protein
MTAEERDEIAAFFPTELGRGGRQLSQVARSYRHRLDRVHARKGIKILSAKGTRFKPIAPRNPRRACVSAFPL